MIRMMLAALLSTVLLAVGAPQISKANSDVALTAAASAAFSDVGRCLASGKSPSLSVFYLIDTSGSLEWTDPENERQGILEGSIEQLGSFVNQGVQVEVAAHFFSTDTTEALDWTSVSGGADAQRIARGIGALITNDNAGGRTNWQEGLELAYRKLSEQSDSCKMLIWFTDGGINPDGTDQGVEASLASLCRAGVGFNSLGSPGDYGLMSKFRKAQIPVFGVLYSNLDFAYEYFKANFPSEADDLLAREKWLMSFMRPLVEGQGQIASEKFDGNSPADGAIQCAELQRDGTAPPEQTNGAFLNAEDPVALAYQFLKLGTQISGGSGSQILNGKFSVPVGTAKFIVLVAGDQWEISGPDGSGISASASSPATGLVSLMSAGATAIEVKTVNNDSSFGEWRIETSGKQAELFLYTGLTFTLDRDRSSKILSEYANTITGRLARTQEFEGYEINLDDYPDSEIAVFYLQGDTWIPVAGVEIEKLPSGEFSLGNFVPPANIESLSVLLKLGLGNEFSSVESEFELVVQDKNSLARATTDSVVLSNLAGPNGRAEGLVTLQGPNVSGSAEFCFAEQLRIEDTQTGIEKVERKSGFIWSFSNQTSGEESGDNCFQIGLGEEIQVLVSVGNATQADSEVVSVWNITSKTEGVDASFEAPIRFQFNSETETNQVVALIVLAMLMAMGLILPLAAMSLLNFLTTRFLDVHGAVRASFPVKIAANSNFPLLSDARPGESAQFKVGTRDFLGVLDERSPRSYDTGKGEAVARIPIFPLGSTWYEWRAPEGSRVVTSNLSSSKQTKDIKSGRATEVSPNVSENWALVIPDSELLKGEMVERSGSLVVFAPAGNIPAYEARVQKILSSPRLKEDIRDATNSVVGQKPHNDKSFKTWKKPKANVPGLPSVASEPTTPLSKIPGFGGIPSEANLQGGAKGKSEIPGFGEGPRIGGSPGSAPNVPGFGTNPGSPNNSKPPWLKD